VVFFDEPLTGLDPLAIRRMKDTIRRLAAEGAAVVLSSHLLHLVEELCTRILILKNGSKVAHGTVAEIRSQFAADDAGADLEEVFIRVSHGTETTKSAEAGKKALENKTTTKSRMVLFKCDRFAAKRVFEPVLDAIASAGGVIVAIGEKRKNE
jgi:ABC-type multidrug transport system ATPase subunit